MAASTQHYNSLYKDIERSEIRQTNFNIFLIKQCQQRFSERAYYDFNTTFVVNLEVSIVGCEKYSSLLDINSLAYPYFCNSFMLQRGFAFFRASNCKFKIEKLKA